MKSLPLQRIALVLATLVCLSFRPSFGGLQAREPIPDKLVVLTFDDSAKSHFSIVRPLLVRYGFGATFFITEGFDFKDNKQDYMTWDEIAQLDQAGFEIGNHTRDHLGITDENHDQLIEQLEGIDQRCAEHNITKPTSFAWPGNSLSRLALESLKAHGIRFARRGGAPEYPYAQGDGFAYEPMLDHPLLLPSAGDARPDWELDNFIRAVQQAKHGRIAILQFHGVPDTAHDWVNTPQAKFEQYMHYLAVNGYQVIALRDLDKYVDSAVVPTDPWGVIEDRQAVLSSQSSYDDLRTPGGDDDLRFWLTNMLVDHRYSPAEVAAATGLEADKIGALAQKLAIDKRTPLPEGKVRVLPYPGGRHPRLGFRDGAIRPQRESKLSAFLPWDESSYVVVDVPEAIWWMPQERRELLFLAHTHVKTTWDERGLSLERAEWTPFENGWQVRRNLPNGVEFGAQAEPQERDVRLKLWIRNGSPETLTGLVVQNCVMLARAAGFEEMTKENKKVGKTLVACHDPSGTRWIITGWQSCVRPWANAPCPCIHSDPQFEDCPPGETRELHGVLAFYEGTEIEQELTRLEMLLATP